MTPLTRKQIQAFASSQDDDTLDAICALALEALDKREAKTTVRKVSMVWRNYYKNHHEDYRTETDAQLSVRGNFERDAVPITITETEGH
jgi:hypothetical protein